VAGTPSAIVALDVGFSVALLAHLAEVDDCFWLRLLLQTLAGSYANLKTVPTLTLIISTIMLSTQFLRSPTGQLEWKSLTDNLRLKLV
jgi:hypothetical protein